MKGTGFELRAARRSDQDAFFGLFVQIQSEHAEAEPEFYRPPERDEFFQAHFEEVLASPDQHLVFACREGKVVGFVQYFLGLRARSLLQPERRVGYIHGLAVDKAQRRAGCASLLIDHVKQEARKQEITLLGVDFWTFNDAARACYEKAGFKLSREFMWLGL